MKVKLRTAVWWFPSAIKGQRVAHIAQLTCFENIVRTRRFIYSNFFFARRVVEMIVLPQRIVSLCEAMYQSAFLSLEFRLNSVLVSSVAKPKGYRTLADFLPPNSKSCLFLLENTSAKQTKAKKRVFQRMKVKLRAAVWWFPSDIKGQRVALILPYWPVLKILSELAVWFTPIFFFARRVVEMIVLPQRIVSLCEAMYQSAFLSLEFWLNSVLVSSVARPKFKKIVKNSRSTFIQILHRQ